MYVPGTKHIRIDYVWYLDLGYFGGHGRYFLPPLSLSQPVSADYNITSYLLGNLPEFLCFLCSASTARAQHSTAQRSFRTTSSKASTLQSERDNASKQSRASVSSRIYTFIHDSSLCSQNERRNRNPPGLQKYQPFKQLRWCGVVFTLLLSPRPFYFVHPCGVRVVFVDHGLAFSSRQSWTSLSASLHSFAFCPILPCERA